SSFLRRLLPKSRYSPSTISSRGRKLLLNVEHIVQREEQPNSDSCQRAFVCGPVLAFTDASGDQGKPDDEQDARKEPVGEKEKSDTNEYDPAEGLIGSFFANHHEPHVI